MSERRSIEELLAAAAPQPRDLDTRRARSWQRVSQALREPAPSPWWSRIFPRLLVVVPDLVQSHLRFVKLAR